MVSYTSVYKGPLDDGLIIPSSRKMICLPSISLSIYSIYIYMRGERIPRGREREGGLNQGGPPQRSQRLFEPLPRRGKRLPSLLPFPPYERSPWTCWPHDGPASVMTLSDSSQPANPSLDPDPGPRGYEGYPLLWKVVWLSIYIHRLYMHDWRRGYPEGMGGSMGYARTLFSALGSARIS